MSCDNHNFDIWQGCQFNESLVYYESDGTTPINISGYSGKAHFRSNGDLVVSLSTAVSGMTLGAISGTVSLTMPHTVTTSITAPEGEYDVVLITPSGSVLPPILTGHWTLRIPQTQ